MPYSGPLGDPYGDLPLDHADALGNQVAVLEHPEEDLRRNVVGEVADDPQPAGETRTQVHLQKIALDKPRGELRVVRMKISDAFGVDLRAPGHKVRAAQQKLRQHSHTAPHLEHVARLRGRVCGRNIRPGRPGTRYGMLRSRRPRSGRFRKRRIRNSGPRSGRMQADRTARQGVADLACDIEVRQEMLSQRLLGSYFRHSAAKIAIPAGKRNSTRRKAARRQERDRRRPVIASNGGGGASRAAPPRAAPGAAAGSGRRSFHCPQSRLPTAYSLPENRQKYKKRSVEFWLPPPLTLLFA